MIAWQPSRSWAESRWKRSFVKNPSRKAADAAHRHNILLVLGNSALSTFPRGLQRLVNHNGKYRRRESLDSRPMIKSMTLFVAEEPTTIIITTIGRITSWSEFRARGFALRSARRGAGCCFHVDRIANVSPTFYFDVRLVARRRQRVIDTRHELFPYINDAKARRRTLLPSRAFHIYYSLSAIFSLTLHHERISSSVRKISVRVIEREIRRETHWREIIVTIMAESILLNVLH